MLIVTDGAVDLPAQLADSEFLAVVPGEVNGDGGAMVLGQDEFWSLLRQGSYPSTSPPTVSALAEAYGASETVLAIHVSAQLSATVSRAREAAERVGTAVTIVDAQSLSVGAGLVVAAVHRAAIETNDPDPIIELAKALPSRLHTFAIIDHVESLRRSDRAGLLPKAHLAKNHPLVLAVRGRVVPLAQPRHRHGALADLIQRLRHTTRTPGPWALGHGDAHDVNEVMAQLSAEFGSAPAFVTHLDPTVGVHLGPESLVVGVLSGPVVL